MPRKKAGVCRPWYKLLSKVEVPIDFGSSAGPWREEGGQRRAASKLNISTGPGIASPRISKPRFWNLLPWHSPSVNADIGHDVMCPETINGMIILRDDVVKVDVVEVDEVTEE